MKKLLFIAILGIAASCTQNSTKVPTNDSDSTFVDISDSDSVCTDSLVEFAAL